MVIRVEYHIDKTYFIKYKNSFKEILSDLSFEIATLKFEEQLSDREVAEKYDYSVRFVRNVLSKTCWVIRKNGFII